MFGAIILVHSTRSKSPCCKQLCHAMITGLKTIESKRCNLSNQVLGEENSTHYADEVFCIYMFVRSSIGGGLLSL